MEQQLYLLGFVAGLLAQHAIVVQQAGSITVNIQNLQVQGDYVNKQIIEELYNKIDNNTLLEH